MAGRAPRDGLADPTTAGIQSFWHWGIYVSFLVFVVFVWGLSPFETGLSYWVFWPVVGLLAGVFLMLDLYSIRTQGVTWGPIRLLYFSLVVFPPVIVVYAWRRQVHVREAEAGPARVEG